MLSSARCEIAPEPSAPSDARRFVEHALEGWALNALVDDAVLCVSELVTNVVKYGEHPASISLCWQPPTLQIDVADASPVPPVLGTIADPDAPHGRGLALVQSIADAWGVRPVAPTGKVVWCAFLRPDARPAAEAPV